MAGRLVRLDSKTSEVMNMSGKQSTTGCTKKRVVEGILSKEAAQVDSGPSKENDHEPDDQGSGAEAKLSVGNSMD
ncbi:hypothetical protein BM221_003945 [Beauveria bassiana]|uniref:Uncharacterized protein n=1 Tax=Beauveria bassiana TaxID=176275 RepID=A0A2N6NPZ5_BEABA|nr:hypothetical protein BM221_003945 [Beauveria bassiana]